MNARANNGKGARLSFQLVILTLSRLLLNTGLRMVYPFLPELARGIGVSLAQISRLVALRSFVGVLSPVFGPISERYGRRSAISLAMGLFALGCLVVVVWPKYWLLGAALAAISLAKVIYDPAMQAYLGDIVPYRQRGRALAVTELSWSGAFLLGVPAAGFVIERQGWQSPFLWMGLFALPTILFLWWVLPANDRTAAQNVGWSAIWSVIRREPVIWAAALYVFLAMTANEIVLIVYGDWMEGSFGLSLTNLGLATGVIGGAEVAGEVVVGLVIDRLGKRPVIIITGLLTAASYLVIPLVSQGLASALVMLFALFFFFEITVVGHVPLMTQIVPHARAVVMSVILAAGGLGRALGAWIGPVIWARGTFPLLGAVAGLIMLAAVVVLWLWIKEGLERDILQQGADEA